MRRDSNRAPSGLRQSRALFYPPDCENIVRRISARKIAAANFSEWHILSAPTLVSAAICVHGNMSYDHSGSVLFQKQRRADKIGAETAPKHAPWKAGLT